MAGTDKTHWGNEYLGTDRIWPRKWPHHFLFPRAFVRAHVTGLPPVPAYLYHQVLTTEFSKICAEISRRDIGTPTFCNLLDGADLRPRSVLLTFDDGWSSVWSIAYPLARKHRIRFTLFIVPQSIEESHEVRTGLDDGIEPAHLEARDHGPRPALTWGEIREMHASGVVDIQSHSLHHGTVFVAERLEGFCSPGKRFPDNVFGPCILREAGLDVARHQLEPGTPCFPRAPALVASRRFIEHPEVREDCLRVVRDGGGPNFFRATEWENRLRAVVAGRELGRWEEASERRTRFRDDLCQAKQTIESRVPGTRIRILAPPWGVMHPDLPAIAQETGHELIAMAYPFPHAVGLSSLPLYPRLFGDGIWPVLRGPLLGGVGWLQARDRSKARVREGLIP